MTEGELIGYLKLITTLEFWQECFDSFQILGPLAPILLAVVESLIPALPLVAIVAPNVAAHGAVLGFFYSWLGTCIGCTIVFLFFRKVVRPAFFRLEDKSPKVKKAREWVRSFNPAALFVIAIMPFTPSAFLNFAFGVSDFDGKKYIRTIVGAKAVMIALLALFGQSLVESMENPLFILFAVALLLVLWYISRKVREKHGL